MAGFRSVKKYAQAWEDGRVFTSHFVKTSTSSPSVQMYIDTSLFGGTPNANYYATAPLEAATLNGRRGIYHGEDKSPAAKYLASWMCTTTNTQYAGEKFLLDYLLYYPFVDCDGTTTQTLVNSVELPRYEDGAGVMVMPVCTSAGTGRGAFSFTYVNQDGVEKTSPTINCLSNGGSSPPLPGNILSCDSTLIDFAVAGRPFCALAHGDSGVRRINSVTFSVANGGLACFVLVKPLASLVVREASVPSEVTFVDRVPGPPRIYDGAFLGVIAKANATITSLPLAGSITTIWDEGT